MQLGLLHVRFPQLELRAKKTVVTKELQNSRSGPQEIPKSLVYSKKVRRVNRRTLNKQMI